MDKAIEAAAKALWPTAHRDMSDFMLHALKDCLRAYLSALKEDPEVVERVAKEVARAAIGCNTESADNGMVVSVWIHNPAEVARAALSALKGEVKP